MKDTCSRKGDTPPIHHMKKASKILLKLYRKGDKESIERVHKVLHDRSKVPTLQSIQHVIAVEAGYKNWKEMLDFYL